MTTVNLNNKDIQLVLDALEALYENLQYENITDDELINTQKDISSVIAKVLNSEEQTDYEIEHALLINESEHNK